MSKNTFLTEFTTTDKLAQREFDPNETLKWLQNPKAIYWCWGVSRRANLNNKGLLLTVNANHFKGHVLITLAWDDTYTVTFLNHQYNEVKEQITMVYCDVLQTTIDTAIEFIPEYKF